MSRRPLIPLWVAWSLVALLFLTQPAAAERRVALVLGNSTYANSSLALVNPKYDAEDVAAALKGLGFEVLIETDATKSMADKAIVEFLRKAKGADAALFFYAGHAVQYQGQNYLLPVDSDVTDQFSLQTQTVQVENIRAWLAAASRGIKILVLDACRNNPIAERLAGTAEPPVSVATGERTRGLERIDGAQGLIVAFATSPGDVALDGQGRNSPFTKAFLRRLNEPGLEIEMMFRRVASDVNAATSGRQRPETYVSLVSEYYLNQNDRVAWERIKTTDDLATLRDFLERFPSSYFALEARYRLQAVERAREEACHRDTATLDAIGPRDITRARELMLATSCAAVKTAAAAKIASIEKELARVASVCRHEEAELDALSRAGKAAEIEALRQRSECPATVAAAETVLRDLTAKAEAACARDQATLDAIPPQDAAALRDLLAKAPCDAVKTAAAERLDGIEAALLREAELCRREKAEFDTAAPGASTSDVEAFRRRAKCPATIAAIEQKQRELAAAADAACARDNLALERIGTKDAEALRDLARRTTCPQIRTSAEARIAEIEARRAHEAAACERDETQWKPLETSSDLSRVENLRRRIECPAVATAIDRRITELQDACRRDRASFGRIAADDTAALRGFADTATCDEARSAAREKLASIERLEAKKEEACRSETQGLAALRERGADARQELVAFRQQSSCAQLRPDIDALLASLPPPEQINTKPQVRRAQNELRRLGCFDSHANGKLDEGTLEGLNRYFKAKGRRVASLTDVKVSDALLAELEGQKSDLCTPPPPVVAKPAPEVVEPEKPVRHHKKDEIAHLPPPETPHERHTEPKPARERHVAPARAEVSAPRAEPHPARQAVRPYVPQAIPQASGGSHGGGGGSSPIGVGF